MIILCILHAVGATFDANRTARSVSTSFATSIDMAPRASREGASPPGRKDVNDTQRRLAANIPAHCYIHAKKGIGSTDNNDADLLQDDLGFMVFGASKPGCQAVVNSLECCSLCMQYWPRCISWMFIRDGAGNWAGWGNACCLRSTFMPTPYTDEKVDSGYQNFRCSLGGSCTLHVTSKESLSNYALGTDSGLVIQDECGAGGTRASWEHFDNSGEVRPTLSDNTDPEAKVAIFQMTPDLVQGAPGDFHVCYKDGNPTESSVFPTTLGTLTMRGPYTGQHFECTLGVACEFQLTGLEMSPDLILPESYVPATSGILFITGAKTWIPIFQCNTILNPKWATRAAGAHRVRLCKTVNDEVNCFTSIVYSGTDAALAALQAAALTNSLPNLNVGGSSASNHWTASGTANADQLSYEPTTFDASNHIYHAMGNSDGLTIKKDGSVCVWKPSESTSAQVVVYLEVTMECGDQKSDSDKVFWTGLQNPDNCEDDAVDTIIKMQTALSGSTAVNYPICFAAKPTGITDYKFHIGTFLMNGPSAGDYECDISMQCVIIIQGIGLDLTNAIRILPGANAVCASLLVSADFGDVDNPILVAQDSVYKTFDLGYPQKGHDNLPGTAYLICWSGLPLVDLPPNCNAVACKESYNIRIGSFTLRGPQLADQNCHFTLDCTITLAGYQIAKASSIIFLPGMHNCGDSAPPYPDFDGNNWNQLVTPTVEGDFVTQNAADEAKYAFGLATLGTAGTTYRVCFSQTGGAIAEHRTLIGILTMSGPLVATESYKCAMGSSCTVVIGGADLRPQNSLILLKSGTCGVSSTLVDFNPFSPNPNVQGDAKTYQFGTAEEGTAGTYTLCWASNAAVLTDHAFTVGSLTMKGPYPAVKHCILGTPCEMTLTGVELAEGNYILLVKNSPDDCNSHGGAAAWSGMLSATTAEATTLKYDFGTPLSGVPSDYRMCFSFASSAQPLVNVGVFTMRGPENAAHVTHEYECTLTKMCTITIAGIEFADTSGLAIVPVSASCGQASMTPSVFRDVTNPLLVTQTPPYNSFTFGIPTSGLAGEYKLCWAHNPANILDYNVYLGKIKITGPIVLAAAARCTMGFDCIIQLTGVDLKVTNAIAIAPEDDDCNNLPDTLPVFSGIANPKMVESDSSSYFMGTPTSGFPGSYKLCWAADGTSGDLANFSFSVGDGKIVGPKQEAKECALSQPCTISLVGVGFLPDDAIVLIDRDYNCGDSAPILAFFRGFTNPLSSAVSTEQDFDDYFIGIGRTGLTGVVAKICWASNPASLTTYEDYRTFVGQFTMKGPKQRIAMVDRVEFSHNDGPITAYFESGEVVSAVRSAPATGYFEIQTGRYKNYRMYEVNTQTLHAGRLFLDNAREPEQDDWWFEMRDEPVACTLGQPCFTFLEGSGLSATNGLLIIASSSECADSNPLLGDMQGITNPQSVVDDAFDNQYRFGYVTVGGSYASCRVGNPANTCIGSHYKLCWGSDPQNVQDYAVSVGFFEMKGPFVTYTTQCTLGMPCSLRLYGTGFIMANRILIIRAEATCGDNDPFVAQFGGLDNPRLVSYASSDGKESMYSLGIPSSGIVGKYKLCWGFRPLLLTQYNIEVGPFLFDAPGQSCYVKDGVDIVCE